MYSGTAVLELSRVIKRFGGQPAIDEVSLSVEAGATTVLIGPSGCGKSTLLRLMNGLLWPDGGTISFGAEPVTPETVMALRRRMGYVIQEGGLFPHLTARENVTLMARFLGWSGDAMAARVRELGALTHLSAELLERYPAELSGGQRQRVALMRALMLDPPVLLLDEPLGALDPMIRYDLQAELRHIFRSLAKTVVLVTHDLAEAGYLGDQIVLMRAGRIEQLGSMDDLLRAPASDFVGRFVRAQRGHRAAEPKA